MCEEGMNMEDSNFGGLGFAGFQLGNAVFLGKAYYIGLNVFTLLTVISADGSIRNVANCCHLLHSEKKQINLEC